MYKFLIKLAHYLVTTMHNFCSGIALLNGINNLATERYTSEKLLLLFLFFVAVSLLLILATSFFTSLLAAKIFRLQIKEHLPKRSKDMLEAIVRLQSPIRNFSHLREAIKKADEDAIPFPYIPTLSHSLTLLRGIYIKDLAIIEEGNPTLLCEDPKTYNVQKYRMMYRVISDFLGKWKISATVAERVDPLYTFLYVLPHQGEEYIYALSRQIDQSGEK